MSKEKEFSENFVVPMFRMWFHLILSEGQPSSKMKQVHLNQLIIVFFFLQVRDFSVKSTEDGELDDEAQWIYQHAFLEFPISQQQVWLVTVH